MRGRPALHPLHPLSAEEVQLAAAACRSHAARLQLPPLRYNTITLQEPPKQQLLAYESGQVLSLPRLAFCILQTPPEFAFYEALVDLRSHVSTSAVVSWVKLNGSQLDGQPLATPDDCLLAEAIARDDPQVQQMVAARGVSFSAVACDPWAIHACPDEWMGRRLMQVFMYYKDGPDDNEYAHPMDLCPVVDLNEKKVIHVDAYPTPPKIPLKKANYHRQLLDKPFRPPAKPLMITQPQGPSFKVNGHHITWQKWDFRIGFNGREGLVLYDIGYRDEDQGGRRRSVVHRASIVEMCVPYGDPRPPYNRKSALDAGDYGLGFAANSLELGCDCLGEVTYFDGVVSDAAGEPVIIKNAVCLHEEDHGLLWKHLDYRTGYAEVRRGRRLVVSFIMTAVNYEYCFYWYLYQDGTVGCDIKLTGILSTSLLSPDEKQPSHGTLVGAGVNAAHHQHLFSARLDLVVDDEQGGKDLVVCELNAQQQPTGPSNPAGNGFICQETELTTVHQAQRTAAPELNRVWRIKNPGKQHPHSGQPIAYHLYPAQGPCLLAQPDSAVAKRAFFTTKNLFVTPYQDGQLYPAGQYVFQSQNDTGLKQWTQEDRSLLGADPVLWYTFGVTHFVRPEDYPVMPCDQIGFLLKPVGFFVCNPAIDVPPEDPAHSAGDCCNAAGAAGSSKLPDVSSDIMSRL
eukprot:GHUV01019596.1.p1 GENE.GHUV01019596.1~~GHUV01019596.1.p1  ORF type:complete len:681 (+),score=180.46 GHUV01019596.1:3034-5076(+)